MDCANKPIVSVIMPAYNSSQYIAKSIKSVQAQTYTNWELIVVDDCSHDGTAQLITEFANYDSRIKLHCNEKNLGVAKTRNFAIGLCRGEFVAFLDSDDIWHPDKIELQLECFRQSGASLVYTSYAIVDSNGQKQCEDFIVPDSISLADMLMENVIGCSTVMISGELARCNRFAEDYFHEDYVLWMQLLQSGHKMAGIRKVLVDYFFHKDSKSANKLNSAKKRWQIYRDYLNLSFIKSSWYFAHYAFAGLKKYKTAK